MKDTRRTVRSDDSTVCGCSTRGAEYEDSLSNSKPSMRRIREKLYDSYTEFKSRNQISVIFYGVKVKIDLTFYVKRIVKVEISILNANKKNKINKNLRIDLYDNLIALKM